MGFLWRNLSLGKVLLLLLLWFFFIQPWLMYRYSLFVAIYWWMRP